MSMGDRWREVPRERNATMSDDAQQGSMARRGFVALGLGMAAAAMVPTAALAASGPEGAAGASSLAPKPGRRRLGKLRGR